MGLAKSKLKMTNLKKYIDLSLDFSFKKIFGTEPNKDLLISFLNEVFKGRKHIIDLVYNKNEHHGENKEEASAVFDLLCTGNRGEKFLIEVQHSNPVNFKKRALYYTSRLVSEQAPKGNIREWKYDVTEIYFVAVLEKLEKELSGELRYFHDICLCYRETGEVFYEGLAYIYIDLSKFVKKEAELETGLDIWLYSLKHLSEQDDIPAHLKQTIFEKLYDVANYFNMPKEEQDMYNESLKRKWDQEAVLARKLEAGLEQGREEGMKEGREEGREEGIQEGKLEVALEMKKNGVPLQDIAKYTGLSLPELEKLS